MKIKICGMSRPENIKAVADLGPDYMGFICYAPSPRFAGRPDRATLAALPGSISKTAVFVNEDLKTITGIIGAHNFSAIQLHGNEDPGFCQSLRNKVTVIKAFGLDKYFNFERLNDFAVSVDYFLFDTKTDLHGGSGQSFDWSLLDNYRLDIPFFLSGGLSLDNLSEVRSIDHPQFYGVDLNSKFEIGPGIKDLDKLKKAFELLR